MYRHLHRTYIVLAVFMMVLMVACEEEHEHTAPAVNPRDSVPAMVTYGVNTLISDSGVIKYRLVTERWEVNEVRNPSRWIFDKGVLITQFDQKMHIQGYIQCDSAVYYDKLRLWQLHGRVRILNPQGLSFQSDEIYWDEMNHKLWSHSYSHMKMPDKEVDGNWFESNEQMTQYEIKQIHGKFDKNESKFGQPGNGMAVPPGVQPATQSVDTVNGPSANGPHPVGPNKPKFHIVK
ncbi:MAG: LPS export ABC transporter periplasmic protein LptC [Prevotella sp.]|nr:LPS export ABC transporter periplasmic protein LptC [Prevotella sp.]